jgi:diguanylate cyclase (GGDEF)-like protein/PAS domain S-box-containing protein
MIKSLSRRGYMTLQEYTAQLMEETEYLRQRVQELEMSLKIYQEESIRRRDMLETSRDYLQSIIDNIGDPILVIDTQYRVVLANKTLRVTAGNIDPAREGLYCYQVSRLSRMPCKGKKEPCPLKRILRTKAPVSITRRYTDDSGSKTFFDIVAAPILDQSGKIVHIVESCRNITERVEIEEALRESEVRYRSLFEQSSDAILIIQAEDTHTGKILSANRAAGLLHGYTEKELLNLYISDLYTPGSTENIQFQIKRILTGETLRFEAMHRKKDGTIFPVEASVSLMKTGNKKLILAIYRDISKRKEAEEERDRLIKKLEQMSQTDGLTGLFNRQHLDKRLSEEINRAKRYGHPLSLIIFDIDNFKQINDTYGHVAGDKILQKTSSIVRETLRDTDIAGRFGGDEFIVILTETKIDVGVQVAERIRAKIAQTLVPVKKNQSINFSVSIGISQYSRDFATPEEFIAKADKALYAAKQKRNNQITTNSKKKTSQP